MTREEAIEQLKVYRACMSVDGADVEAYNIAIEALKQNPCEDAISRQAVLDIVNNPLNIRLDEIIKGLPSVKPQEPKTGHWIEEDMFDGDVAYRCSECNELFWIESGTPKDNGGNDQQC